MTDIVPSPPRYLWAANFPTNSITINELVENRYQVIDGQLWLDTQPERSPTGLTPIPLKVLPYFHLYPHRLHLPQVYGFCILDRTNEHLEIPLLENIPVDSNGKLLPTITESWISAKPVRRLYWLWQMLNLWTPLMGVGVVKSLLVIDNLRVDGWRLHLRELYLDSEVELDQPPIVKLGEIWHNLLSLADPEAFSTLVNLTEKMREQTISIAEISRILNSCLLVQAAQLPLHWEICGGTDIGLSHDHNEDSYYPKNLEINQNSLDARIGIICDGVGGHEGGEIASQLAVDALSLQVRTLLQEIVTETEIIEPEQIIEHLAATIRVVNNVISFRNNEQNRHRLKRMGTTLVMALQLPQRILTPEGTGNSHELYIAHVGDSRAYWITESSCRQLTVDDDLTTRQVMLGRNLPWEVQSRYDAGALTQALGILEGNELKPTVQRFILEEEGLLLLCSDGLSDDNLVENSWRNYAQGVLSGELSLRSAVDSWLELARKENGHDNITIVMMSFSVTNSKDNDVNGVSDLILTDVQPGDLSSSKSLIKVNGKLIGEEVEDTPHNGFKVNRLLCFTCLLIALGIIGIAGVSIVQPQLFQSIQQRLLPKTIHPVLQ